MTVFLMITATAPCHADLEMEHAHENGAVAECLHICPCNAAGISDAVDVIPDPGDSTRIFTEYIASRGLLNATDIFRPPVLLSSH